MLDAAEAHLGADCTLTLDSAARDAGVSKPGLMYHFATKEALLNAILDRMIFRYEAGLLAAVGGVRESGGMPLRGHTGPVDDGLRARTTVVWGRSERARCR